MRAVFGTLRAGPGVLVAGGGRIPGAEIDARGDDLAVIVGGQPQTVGGEVGRVAVTSTIEHGGFVMQAAVHGGDFDACAGVFHTADSRVRIQRRGVDQRDAGVQIGIVRIVMIYRFDIRQRRQGLEGGSGIQCAGIDHNAVEDNLVGQFNRGVEFVDVIIYLGAGQSGLHITNKGGLFGLQLGDIRLGSRVIDIQLAVGELCGFFGLRPSGKGGGF